VNSLRGGKIVAAYTLDDIYTGPGHPEEPCFFLGEDYEFQYIFGANFAKAWIT
jgi:hypothetical protein